ncbi:membrane hypothetical protein [Nitrospina gracilis 3/211]|uniref:Uncharacterized protein n=1 Tax=Nitrospina gracilis (strain 3/211) TaxID=1266370 RepID=M1Z9A4_NITG3|nr:MULTISPECIES: hypothetical protein [Nitrospina]MCF8722770.1 hypothetical protein [Nitrospina sp. Nb-3]CCQ89720.1 membrane hypothetical protein [Nitrospina gracilis 3/211]
MQVLVWGLALLILALALHLIIWKIRLPQRQTKVLLQIFFGTLVLGSAVLWTNPEASLFGVTAPTRWAQFLHIALMFTAFTLAYMITYSGLEADSPSLVMVQAVAEAGKPGLPVETFFERMNDDVLVKPRLRDLLTDKMAVLEDGRYRLTPKGRLMARLFVVYRSLFKAGKGG